MTYLGNHTYAVQRGLNLGVGLFIVSEALFFLAIFWTFFHSSLSPNIELGAQWPPMGIHGINPFELPLLNTIILLSSGVTVTYSHHSVIQGNRKGALYGLIYTILLAALFTVLQGIEYTVSSFTISDGIYGSCFFFGTGFHGLINLYVALYIFIYIILKIKQSYKIKISNIEINNIKTNSKLLITIPSYKNKEANFYYLEKSFIEWFVGFTDSEGNFNIKITGLTNNTFKNVQFIFHIGLHKDEIKVLEYIMNTLNCGHISKSENRINYFVNDINSLLYVIIPIFNYINLNSSKYHHFTLFKKAVMLTKNKNHLLDKGKLEIIKYQKEMQNMSGKWIPSSISNNINITKYWLVGFIDGDGTFSTNKYVPKFKLENHIKELELYNKIREFLKIGNVMIITSRINKFNNNFTIVLEISKIRELKKILIPLIYDNDYIFLKSLKHLDFLFWLKLVDIYYKGYHTILKGKYVFNAIKLHMNKYRLTTNIYLLNNIKRISIFNIEVLLSELYLLDSPYEVIQGIRYYRNTKKLVCESTNIIVINTNDNNNRIIYNNISECAESLYISRKKIKYCLNTGKSYKGYDFILN